MAITAQPYGQFLADVTKGVHNLGTDPDYISLLTSSYTPNYATHAAFSDVSGFEVSGSGYTAGGAQVTLTPATYTAGSTNNASVAAADVSWASVTVTFRYAALYRQGSPASAGRLIGLFDFGTDKVYTASPLKLSFPNGIMTVSKV